MIEAILGKKVGMTQRFDESGSVVPVTVIEAGPCHVMQIKTVAVDGYEAVQLGFDDRKRRNAKKPELGHARKAKVEPKRFIREVRVRDEGDLLPGSVVTVEALADVKIVDVIGTSKGKGFQGVVKRHHFGGRPMTHGSSKDHRRPGSIGSSSDPSRVFKGARMAGHMGQDRCTVRNLRVVEVDKERNLLLVQGGIPGANGDYVIVQRNIVGRQQDK